MVQVEFDFEFLNSHRVRKQLKEEIDRLSIVMTTSDTALVRMTFQGCLIS